ncbi:MAG: MFS transporter [Gracilibacteraceae bacterium]|jgi:MFS family permease|nr:MFS transporter [Gracilibacteraceae bacterium]
MREKTIFSKDFILVVTGRIVSAFGNQILRYALPLYLLIQTGSAALFGTIMAAAFIPMVLLFPIGGIIADRLNKRNIMLALDFCTAAVVFIFCLLSGKIDIVPLMTVTLIILYGIDGADRPAVKASVPALVNAEHMMRANSIVDVVDSAAAMAGPVIGGLLFSVFGLTPILYVSIGCFFASVALDIFIHIPFEKKAAAGNIFATGISDLRESFSFMLRKRPTLWKISLIFASSNLLLTTLVLIGLPVIITQHLGFGPGGANRAYGYAQGVIAAGAILGGLLAGVLSNKLKSTASPALLIGCSLCVILGGAALQTLSRPMGSYLVLIIACALMLALHTLFQIQMVTYLQLLTPKDLIGKVISCFICVVMCTNPLGQFAYGFVFEHIGSGIYLPFYAAGLVMTGVSILTRRVFDDNRATAREAKQGARLSAGTHRHENN